MGGMRPSLEEVGKNYMYGKKKKVLQYRKRPRCVVSVIYCYVHIVFSMCTTICMSVRIPIGVKILTIT